MESLSVDIVKLLHVPIGIYCSDYVGKPGEGVKFRLNPGLLCNDVWELDVVRALGKNMASNTAGIILLMEGWEMTNQSPVSHWKVPVAKNPRVERTLMCTGMELVQFVPRSNTGPK